MKQAVLKPIRIVLALLFLVITLFLFIDIARIFPSDVYKTVTSIQFVPSLMKFINTGALLAATFLIILFLTMLFGRFYCSAICPLGILQDVIAFVKRKIKKKKFRYTYASPYSILRYTFLLVTILVFISGSSLLVNLLDPYSNFGRIASGLFKPLYTGLNNILAGIMENFNVYTFYKVDLHMRFITLIYPLFIFGLILILVLAHGRLFCNTVCPVGTLLGLFSKISFLKITFNKETCTKCNKCSLVCKAECINVKEQHVDFSRCVGCYNCIQECPENAIYYQPTLRKKKTQALQEINGRREFIARSVTSVMVFLGISRLTKALGMHTTSADRLIRNDKKFPVSPPGSLSIEKYNHACTACHLCVSACPTNVLQPSFLEYGLQGFLQPHMDYTTSYCNYECTICSEVCPTGAILPLTREEKITTQMGYVQFIKQNCVVVTEGTACGACAEHCPTQAVTMVPYQGDLTIPETNTEICVGCGACEHICPVEPATHKAIFVEGNPVHKRAKKPAIEEADFEELEEFPF